MQSILDKVRFRTENLAAESVTDLEIPTWGSHGHPKAWLRVHPVDITFIDGQRRQGAKLKGDAAIKAALRAHAVIVAKATERVVIGEGDDQAEFDLADPDLLEALGIPDCKSNADAIRRIIGVDITGADGYLVAMSNAVAEHSGMAAEVVEESLLGD